MPMIQRGRPTNKVQRKRAREVFHAECYSVMAPEKMVACR
jgi:hypothetical protein